mmetsp:Transcript_60313/g.51071  ORF Transcript_60313/g.51071 Transcript_60313/m.51071 type:complete len:197 (+) Transcript_60313:433-1023(+)
MLHTIQKRKAFPEPIDFEKYRQSESNILNANEAKCLKLLLKSLISHHAAWHNDLGKEIKALIQGLPGAPELTIAPVKGEDRAFTKLKEKVEQDPQRKFPLDSLKDLSRASLIFKSADELFAFFNAFTQKVDNKQHPCFAVHEIKNMFANTSEANKYAYKDVKIVLGYTTPAGSVLNVEVQLILDDILKLKVVLHKF